MIDIAQIKALQAGGVALDKTRSPVLVHLAPNHLFCDDVRGRREAPSCKLVDLTNKSLFLRISQEFVVYGGRFGSGGGLAFVPSH